MTRYLTARFGLSCYLSAFALVERLRFLLSAPDSGFDRAGGPYNGHPARKRQTEGAAATADHTLGKDGNGALHSRGISARCIAASSGNVAFPFPSTGDA